MADLGYGSTLSFDGNDWDLTNITFTGPTIETFRTTNLGTTGGHEFIGSDVYDPGEITAEILWDNSQVYPTFPTTAGADTDAFVTFGGAASGAIKFTASAFLTAFTVNAAVEDLMTASVTLKLSGDLTAADVA